MTKKISKEKLIVLSKATCGADWEEAYNDLCYILGPLYWGYDYAL